MTGISSILSAVCSNRENCTIEFDPINRNIKLFYFGSNCAYYFNTSIYSLLNLGLGTFVPTGSSPPGSDGIVHDMCGVHPYNGLVYGGARALPYPFDFAAAVRES